jgi:inorganic pyrophosphatase
MKLGLWALIALTALFCLILPLGLKIFLLIYSAIAFGVLGSLYLSKSVLECDDGTEEMRQVSDPIREGAEGFLTVQYSAIAKIALPLSFLLVLSYQFRPETHLQGISQLGNLTLGIVSAAGFLVGAVCSAISGYVSMWVAAQSNIRVASAGRRSYTEALVVCFRGGAFSALLNLTLCVAGVATFYVVLYQMFCMNGLLVATNLPMLMVGVSVVYSCIGCIGCIFMERFVENAMLSNCQIYLYLCTCVHSLV